MAPACNLLFIGEKIIQNSNLKKNLKSRDIWDFGLVGSIILKWILYIRYQNMDYIEWAKDRIH